MPIEYVLSPEGDIDIAAVAKLRREWLELIDHHHSDTLVIDLSHVPFLDCRGVGLIVSAYKVQRARGASLAIVNARPLIRRVLAITQVDTLVDVRSNQQAGDPEAGRSLAVARV